MTNAVINHTFLLAPVEDASWSAGNEANKWIEDDPFKSHSNEDWSDPVVGGGDISDWTNIVHVPNSERIADPEGNENQEIVNKDIVLSIIIMFFLSICLVVEVLLNVISSEEPSNNVGDTPSNWKGLKRIGNNLPWLNIVVRISFSEPEGIPNKEIEDCEIDKRGSCFSGENFITNSSDRNEGMVSPSSFLVIESFNWLKIHWQSPDKEEQAGTDCEPETVVSIKSDSEISSVAKSSGRLSSSIVGS